MSEPGLAPWVALALRHQFMLNVLGSVSIEVPALQPAFRRLVAADVGEGALNGGETSGVAQTSLAGSGGGATQ